MPGNRKRKQAVVLHRAAADVVDDLGPSRVEHELIRRDVDFPQDPETFNLNT
jgi:hypothetical protein